MSHTPDRRAPSPAPAGGPFDLPVRGVRSALDHIASLGSNATGDEIFRAGRQLSAATGLLARLLNQADQAARLRQGLPAPPVNDVAMVHEEVLKEEAVTDAVVAESTVTPEQSPPSSPVS
jgi:hypothetical protein